MRLIRSFPAIKRLYSGAQMCCPPWCHSRPRRGVSLARAQLISVNLVTSRNVLARTVDTQSFVPTAGNCASGRLITGANNRWLSRCRSMTNYLFVSRQRCGYGRGLYIWSDLGPPPLALTRQRHDRLMLMLRALDGHLADASYRDIADVLFGARRLEHEPWKTSSVRDTTIRLVRGGLALMRAGYRKLLRGR